MSDSCLRSAARALLFSTSVMDLRIDAIWLEKFPPRPLLETSFSALSRSPLAPSAFPFPSNFLAERMSFLASSEGEGPDGVGFTAGPGFTSAGAPPAAGLELAELIG